MDAWIRPALLCATLLSVSAAPDAEPEATAAAAPSPAIPAASGSAEPDLAARDAAALRTAGFDGVFRTPEQTEEAAAAAKLRTAAKAGQARHRTKNFICYAKTSDLAREVCFEAERQRELLAKAWLGKTLPDWPQPCPITVTQCYPGKGAGGATTFGFHTVRRNGRDEPAVGGFRMQVEGSRERLLDSVIPHEVNHTIFASYFRRPLPRWADEGAATLTEFKDERMRQRRTLRNQWNTHRYRLTNLIGQTEYPGNPRNPAPGDADKVMQVYAQGYSLAEYLVERGGRTAFLRTIGEASKPIPGGGRGGIDWEYPLDRWEKALQKNFGMSVQSLEKEWYGWVMAGCQPLSLPDGVKLAADRRSAPPVRSAGLSRPAGPKTQVRAQNPETSGRRPAAGAAYQRDEPTGSFADSRRMPVKAAATQTPPARPAPLPSFIPHDRLAGLDR